MSEYQLYEFKTVDRPLNATQMAKLRAISTRATISSTSFRNEYNWGDLGADPLELTARYFDAHLYAASWGTYRLILRMPKTQVDAKALKPYIVDGDARRLRRMGGFVIVDLTSDMEWSGAELLHRQTLRRLLPLRVEIMSGDLRPAYLAWLLAVQAGDVDEEAREPAVPPGLHKLTAPQRAMVDFLHIDIDLVAAAASISKRAPTRRTVDELRASAELQRSRRESAEAERAHKAVQAAARVRQRRLTMLGRDIDAAWVKLERLVASNAPDDALKLAVDLRDLAQREGDSAVFRERFKALRGRNPGRRRFFAGWRQANQPSGVDRSSQVAETS